MTGIGKLLEQQSLTRPQQAAIIDTLHGKSRMTNFDELREQVDRAASRLLTAGIQHGDAVLVFQTMSVELYVALLAIFRVGAIAMFLDPSAGTRHIAQCCIMNPPKALIASTRAHLLRLICPPLNQIPVRFAIGGYIPNAISWERLAERGSVDRTDPRLTVVLDKITEETPALLTFTSGSTGEPKAAMRTHGFLLSQQNVLSRSLNLTPTALDMATLPIFVLANLASGVTSIIPDADLRRPAAINAARVIAQIDTYKPSTIAASPAFFERLVEFCETHTRTLPSLVTVFTGGAPVFPGLLDRLQQVAANAKIVAVYGSTEAEPIAHIDKSEIKESDYEAMLSGHGLIAGRPVPEIKLRIINHQWGSPIRPLSASEFESMLQNTGEAGEIVVSGAHVLSGYLHGKGDEETKFQVDGIVWHRTGDSGTLDKQGRLWLLGRSSARVHDADGILYPFAIETAAKSIPGIKRAALVALGGRRVLVVEPDGKKQGNELDVKAALEQFSWAKIAGIKLVAKIPVDKRHNAKVDYPALLKLMR
jgi:acyl-CoA synthetase (AMP-forming)/AMP-acid ligase II